MNIQEKFFAIVAILTLFTVGCSTPATIQRTYENTFSFDYEDIITGETGRVAESATTSSSIFSQVFLPNNEQDSLIDQRFHLTYRIDTTGTYNLTEVSFRTFGITFSDTMLITDARVIGLNPWAGDVYSFADPAQYLSDFFPPGATAGIDFRAGADFDLHAYGYTTTADYGPNPIGSNNISIDYSEIVTDAAGVERLYLEGRFSGTTVSRGYPTVQLDFGQGVMRITNGRFAGSWVIE